MRRCLRWSQWNYLNESSSWQRCLRSYLKVKKHHSSWRIYHLLGMGIQLVRHISGCPEYPWKISMEPVSSAWLPSPPFYHDGHYLLSSLPFKAGDVYEAITLLPFHSERLTSLGRAPRHAGAEVDENVERGFDGHQEVIHSEEDLQPLQKGIEMVHKRRFNIMPEI